MPIIESVKIGGFWGNHSVFLKFDPDVNFLVGVNGSGKTTAIDILASALQCDEEALDRLPFDTIEIVLYDKETRKKPSIVVERASLDDSRFSAIRYKIKDSAKATLEDTKVFSPFDFLDREVVIAHERRMGRDVRYRVPRSRYHFRDARAEIAKLIKMNWLSINRVSTVRANSERSSNETLVDRKVIEISDRLERYFSELSSNANLRTREFQRKLFRSLIDVEGSFALSGSLDKMNLQAEKSALIDIFDRFNIPVDEYHTDTEKFFKLLEDIQGEGEKEAFQTNELLAVINAYKIHSLVDDWNKAVEDERETLTPRDAFVEILDNMFHRKKAQVLPSGEMVFQSRSGKSLSISDLSSGEKQLFIILGEALLQKDSEWTYIADEPELSLHVDWQEVLVDNLRALNPNSQVIFATHSPDIISHYSEYVIDMEKVIQ